MSAFTSRIAAASAFVMFTAGAGLADVTADQIWSDWQTLLTDMGQTVSVGSEERSGNVLTLRDVSFTGEFPEGGMTGTIAEMSFTERGDGTVEITYSPEIPLDFRITPAEGGAGTFTMLMRTSGMTTIASGGDDNIAYDFVAPEFAFTVSEFEAEGEPFDMTFEIALASVAGRYSIAGDTERQIDSEVTAATMTMTMVGTDPEGSGDSVDLTATVANIASSSTGTLSSLAAMGDLGAALKAGMTSNGTMTHGPASYEMRGTSEGSTFDVRGKAASGTFDFSLSEEGIDYGGSNTGVELAVSGSDIPFPELSFAAAESAGRLAMPMTESDEPQNIALVLRLIDLTINDMIWSMFDPGGALPRDPATLIVDLSGKANWLVDVFAPGFEEEALSGPPGQLHSVDVNELRLTAAGAELTGDGAFTFDNSVVNSLNAMPQPSGTLNLQLVGGNGLLDRLVQMGMLPEDQAMGARMMLGLFARPGGGEDTLVSEITVQPDGAILANGQRIK